METKEINKLLDDIQDAKTEIQKLGRTVFKLSSVVAELRESDKIAIRSSLVSIHFLRMSRLSSQKSTSSIKRVLGI
mgnify:CR=1 FL=1